MAFKNVLIAGSYTTIDAVEFSKRNRLLSIDLTVWQSEAKEKIIAQMPIKIEGVVKSTVVSKVISVLPESPDQQNLYLLVAEANHIYEQDGEEISNPIPAGVVWFNGSGWNSIPYDSVYDGKKFYRRDDAGYVEDNDPKNDIWFDATFGIAEQNASSDLYAFCYKYLKTRKEFSTAEDC